jgi:hypothetical protein
MLEVVTGVECSAQRAPRNGTHYYPTPPIDGTRPEKIPLLYYVPYL